MQQRGKQLSDEIREWEANKILSYFPSHGQDGTQGVTELKLESILWEWNSRPEQVLPLYTAKS